MAILFEYIAIKPSLLILSIAICPPVTTAEKVVRLGFKSEPIEYGQKPEDEKLNPSMKIVHTLPHFVPNIFISPDKS